METSISSRSVLRYGLSSPSTTSLCRFADLAFEDFELRLRALNRLIESAIAGQKQRTQQMNRFSGSSLAMTPDDAELLLAHVKSLESGSAALSPLIQLTESEREDQECLRRQAQEAGYPLPFDLLARELELTEFEIDVVTLCASSELDSDYGRLFGFILDNLNRQTPSIELICTLGEPGIRERLARRRMMGPQARLRRSGVIAAVENAERPLHTTLSVSPLVFRRITQSGRWSGIFFDPDLVVVDSPRLDFFRESESLGEIAAAIRGQRIEVCGIWGNREQGVDEAVAALASASNRPLFRLPTDLSRLDASLAAAEDRHGMLWLPVDTFSDVSAAPSESLRDVVAARLARSALPVCLSGEFPWRPTALLAARAYTEVRMRGASWQLRKRIWREAVPTIDETLLDDAATRFRLSPREVQAVGKVVRAGASLDEACVQVTQRYGMRFTKLVEPRRGPDDLVLPAGLHRQVLELTRFYRSLLHVDDEWGFGRIATGGGGIKALFTGESGTGKTLAAEVIAGQLGLGLMKVDVSQLVSKWVGETEKNLECAFREAEDSHAVLFFDEADTLCGKRGEIRNGSDRYANLEVGFLLQRLEQYGGLAVLATNLSDEMDQAFVRRFQVVLHFPRPRDAERRRLWQIAFPSAAPLDAGIDFDAFVKLDMTGASIMGAARKAALLAADESCDRIRENHVLEGIRRQYQQESRLLHEEALKPAVRNWKQRR